MSKKLVLTLLSVIVTGLVCASPVTPERARQVAVTFWNSHYPEGQKPVSDLQQLPMDEMSHMYFFTNGDKGFVIVSADDRVQPILGYSFDTPFGRTLNPELRYWLNNYETQIEASMQEERAADYRWEALNEDAPEAPLTLQLVPALLTTRWDQFAPYNNLCPYDENYQTRSVVGCVATAMAQIMKRWNFPHYGNGSHYYMHHSMSDYNYSYGMLSADFAHTTYRWDRMIDYYGLGLYSELQAEAVATLSYHCGVAVDMMYGPAATGGSGAYSSCGEWTNTCAVSAFVDNFKYKPSLRFQLRYNFVDSAWLAMIDADLAEGRPIYYSGRDSSGGHAFVLDGSNLDTFYHFNWGWSGYGNGFYPMNNLAPSAGGAGGNATSTYNYDQGAIFGIEPGPEYFNTIEMYDTVCSNATSYTYRGYTFPAVTCDTQLYFLDTLIILHLTRVNMKVVTFKANGASGDDFSQQFCIVDSVAMPECPFVHDSLTFKGWCTDRRGSGTIYRAGQMVKFGGNTSLYAIWYDPTAVGVDRVEHDALQIWPNPTTGELNIAISDQEAQVTVFDMMGRMVLREDHPELEGGVLKISLQGLPDGLYMVQVKTLGDVYKRRIIKQ